MGMVLHTMYVEHVAKTRAFVYKLYLQNDNNALIGCHCHVTRGALLNFGSTADASDPITGRGISSNFHKYPCYLPINRSQNSVELNSLTLGQQLSEVSADKYAVKWSYSSSIVTMVNCQFVQYVGLWRSNEGPIKIISGLSFTSEQFSD